MGTEDKNTQNDYKIFIYGELINLCIPCEKAIEKDDWANWFNKIEKLKNTGHGIYPNSDNNQRKFLKELENDKTKIVLLVCDKKSHRAFGVVSLQNIDFRQRSAEIAINIGAPELSSSPSFAALETMAMMTEHGFEELGVQRVYAGQAYPNLASWNKMLELIGYKTEGITRNSFVRGQVKSDTAIIACHYKFYKKLRDIRGSLWGSKKIMKYLILNQPKDSFINKLNDFIKETEDDHYNYLLQNHQK